ncbi:Pycsar system effector family protein [Micromonospora matsumotoense]|uniref:Pycsar system effector family protein n=1 Tax=Micromonospora matsumotoense TaxID=121616 RepID=UPI003440E02C
MYRAARVPNDRVVHRRARAVVGVASRATDLGGRSEVDQQAALRLAERLTVEARDELRRADAKASQWLTMSSGVALAMLTLLTGTRWSPRQLTGAAAWAWWSGCACAGVALFALAMALLPRTAGAAEVRQVAYFGHVHRLRDPALVRRYVERAAQDTMPGLISQLCWLSRLVMIKYRWVRAGTVLISLAAALVALALL